MIFTILVGTLEAGPRSIDPHTYVLFLVDASGSMRRTDPQGYRKLAVQAAISLLSPHTRVAVAEFGERVRVIVPWREPSSEVAARALEVGESDLYTDYAIALDGAVKLFKEVPADARKVVIFLTDGLFDPNPTWGKYAPYWLEFRRRTFGKSRAEAYKIYETVFRKKIRPVGDRVLFDEILPELHRNRIDLFILGFGSAVDASYLERMAYFLESETREARFFRVSRAPDLVNAFLDVLGYLGDQMVLNVRSGSVVRDPVGNLYFDQFLENIRVIFVFDHPAEVFFRGPDGSVEPRLRGFHPNLVMIKIRQKPPGEWSFRVHGLQGTYRMLVVGQSLITVEVRGVNASYRLGDTLHARILPVFQNRDARKFLDPSSSYRVRIWWSHRSERGEEFVLPLDQTALKIPLKDTGRVQLQVTLLGTDRKGRPMLPRPSRTLTFRVVSHFHVEPEHLSFGSVSMGDTGKGVLHIQYGLGVPGTLRIQGLVERASRCQDAALFPVVLPRSVPVKPGQTLVETVAVAPVAEGCWGDFEGILRVLAPSGEERRVVFRVHYTSIWEKLTRTVIYLILLALLVIASLAIIWGRAPSPYGTLQIDRGSELRPDIDLRYVKRGFVQRLLNWRKNRVTLGGPGSDIVLDELPRDVRLELIFSRGFRRKYVRLVNRTRDTNWRVFIQSGGGDMYEIRPDQKTSLRPEDRIVIRSESLKYALTYRASTWI